MYKIGDEVYTVLDGIGGRRYLLIGKPSTESEHLIDDVRVSEFGDLRKVTEYVYLLGNTFVNTYAAHIVNFPSTDIDRETRTVTGLVEKLQNYLDTLDEKIGREFRIPLNTPYTFRLHRGVNVDLNLHPLRYEFTYGFQRSHKGTTGYLEVKRINTLE